jgi:hypothetical protein
VVRWFPIKPGYAIAVLVYLAGAIGYMVIANANTEDGGAAVVVLAVASLACGWSAGWWPVSLLPLVLAPLGMLFGYPESPYAEPAHMSLAGALVTLPSAGLILVGAGLRGLWSRLRARRMSIPARHGTRRPRATRGRRSRPGLIPPRELAKRAQSGGHPAARPH